jgi:hypothetical protein
VGAGKGISGLSSCQFFVHCTLLPILLKYIGFIGFSAQSDHRSGKSKPNRNSEAVRKFYNCFGQARLVADMRITSICNYYGIYALAQEVLLHIVSNNIVANNS